MFSRADGRQVQAFLTALSGWWIFPVLAFAAGTLLLEHRYLLYGVLAAYFLLKGRCSFPKELQHAVWLMMLLGVLFFGYAGFSQTQTNLSAAARGSFLIQADPTQTLIEEDYWQARVQLQTAKGSWEKVLVKGTITDPIQLEQLRYSAQPLLLRVAGELEKPAQARNFSGFSQADYLAEKGIQRVLVIEKIERSAAAKKPFFNFWGWRKQWILNISAHLPEHWKNLILSLFFNERLSGFRDWQISLKRWGIMHFFALSGLHLQFFLTRCSYLFRRGGLPLHLVPVAEGISVLFLMGVAAFSVSILRAGIQHLFGKANQAGGRPFSAMDIWAFTLLIMLVISPAVLLTVGGQLSLFLPLFLRLIERGGTRKISHWLREQFWLVMFLLPLQLAHFYQYSLIGIFFGLLLTPLLSNVIFPLIILAAIVIGLFPAAGGSIFFEGTENLVRPVLSVVDALPLRPLVFGKLPIVMLFIGFLLIWNWHDTLPFKKAAPRCTALIMLLYCASYCDPRGEVTFVDVGQGDSIYIQMPFQKENLLIDVGGRMNFSGKPEGRTNADDTLIPYLKARGVKQLKHVVLTHGDTDHLGDILAVAKEIPIEKIYYPAGCEKNALFHAKQQALQKQVRFVPLRAGMTLPLKQAGFHVLHPLHTEDGGNDDSLVVYAAIQKTRFLFTGDLEKSGEQALLNRYPHLTVDVLKVGHHGSRTSTDPEFLRQLAPKIAVISCGKENRFGHPHPEVLDNLAEHEVKVLRTDQAGAIRYQWTPHDSPHWASVKNGE